ncbi:hypothetical protein N7490_010047 [Penicillium lividum]|nr:hypothetical protein N7490_010047 [Penicillium lividum]
MPARAAPLISSSRNLAAVPTLEVELGVKCVVILTLWFSNWLSSLLDQGLTDGGTAGLIWGYLIVAFGFLLVFLSLAEMASMAPTFGGQYHWVSEFAPPSCQKFLSYITGWLCAMGRQCAIISIAFLAGTIIQELSVLNSPSYDFQRWHGTLLVGAITLFTIIFNTLLAKRLPFVEVLIFILHVCGLFAIIIPLWVLGPRRSAKQVFTEFNNGGGWDSAGTATLVGFSTTITALIGYDFSVHMSEEIKDASETLPQAMITSVTPGWNIPLNAVMVSLVGTVLSLINIGSTVALLALVTLTISAMMFSYIITIACVLLKRIRGEPLPPHKWTLGRFGMAINIGALCFLFPVFVFAFFPLTSTVDPVNMNWSSVMYGGILIIAVIYYVLRGRHHYIPPVALVN